MNLNYEQERLRIIFEYSPIAIWEEDFSALAKLQKIIRSKNVVNIRKFLKENRNLVTETFRHIKVLDVNKAALHLYGVQTKKELIANLGKTIHREALNVLVDEFASLLEGKSFYAVEFKSRTVTGHIYDVSMRVSVPEMYKDTFERVIVTFEDVSMRKKLERDLLKMAQTDGLTKLCNQNTIVKKLEEEFIRAKRYNLALSCMMIDLDSFKKINDQYGHQKGNQVLKLAAYLIKSGLREVDFVGRYGGDEFLVVLPETSLENAMIVANRLKQIFTDGKSNKQLIKLIRLSIGIGAFIPEETKTVKELIVKTDKAMYKAKQSGGNQIAVI